MNVQIAQASPLDRESFVEAISRARMHAVYPAPASVAARRSWLNFEDSSFRGWWARIDGELVGVAFRQLIGDWPNQYAVADVCVVPSARGAGVGSALAEALRQDLVPIGLISVGVHNSVTEDAGIRFATKYGLTASDGDEHNNNHRLHWLRLTPDLPLNKGSANSHAFRVRQVEPSPDIYALYAQGLASIPRPEDPDDVDQWTRDWRAFIGAGGTILAVHVADTAVGAIFIHRVLGQRGAFLTLAVTDETARRRGIGRSLIHAALDWAREHQLEFLAGQVDNENVASLSLVLSVGFQPLPFTQLWRSLVAPE